MRVTMQLGSLHHHRPLSKMPSESLRPLFVVARHGINLNSDMATAGVTIGFSPIPNLTINPETPDSSGISLSYCIRILEDFDRLREKDKCTGFRNFIRIIQ